MEVIAAENVSRGCDLLWTLMWLLVSILTDVSHCNTYKDLPYQYILSLFVFCQFSFYIIKHFNVFMVVKLCVSYLAGREHIPSSFWEALFRSLLGGSVFLHLAFCTTC